MSTPRDFKVYRFTNASHWKNGLLSKLRIKNEGALVPERPLVQVGGQSVDHAASGFPVEFGNTNAVVYDGFGAVYWRTSDGKLHWQDQTAYRPCEIEADAGIISSLRLVPGRQWLWAFKPETNCLLRYDLASLQLSGIVRPFNGYDIVDIATDGKDGVWICLVKTVENGTQSFILCRVSCHGRIVKQHLNGCKHAIEHTDLPCNASPLGLTYLAETSLVVMLGADGKSVMLLNSGNPEVQVTVSLSDETPGFTATHIDSDHRGKVVLVGYLVVPEDVSKKPALLLLDSTGGLLDLITEGLNGSGVINGATAWSTTVIVATDHGLLHFQAEPASHGVGANGIFITPALYSPDNDSLRGWLRAEISAVLPRGATLTVKVMGTDDSGTMEEVKRISQNAKLPPITRQTKIKRVLKAKDSQDFVFTSPQDEASYVKSRSSSSTPLSPQTYAVPLFDHAERWVWLEVALKAAPDGDLPELREMRVIYPEISLSQYVPAIFRGDVTARDPKSGDPSGFFRQLLGVLETTTQGIDQTIANLGRNIHPDIAPVDWLDYLAGWLDVPWDDALPEQVKRRLLGGAAQLLNLRGTRAGLEWLLQLLFPSGKGKTRVIDVDADIGFAVLGCKSRPDLGSALPAMLSGLPADASVLSRRALLGQMRLNRLAESDPIGIEPIMGRVRITISASDSERAALEAIVAKLVLAVIPSGLRINIRWRPQAQFGFTRKLDQGFILDNPSPRRLSQDAQLGLLILAGGQHQRLTESGLSLGFRLK